MLTEHMLKHVVVMNMVAPLTVLAGRSLVMRRVSFARWLGPIAALQMGLLWGLHLPGSFGPAVAGWGAGAAMHLSLGLASLLFWAAVVDASERRIWGALSALLLTAKVSCLLGVILTFAPRPLYPAFIASSGGDFTQAAALDDQQVAGLLMLTAFTLSYVGAAVVIVARWLAAVDKAPGWNGSS